MTIYKLRREASPETKSAGALILNCFSCLSHPICGILLWQHKLTHTLFVSVCSEESAVLFPDHIAQVCTISTDIIFVFYCSVTIYHTSSGLQHPFIISQFPWVKSVGRICFLEAVVTTVAPSNSAETLKVCSFF